jgi:anti-sigma-K factor RskA
VTVSDHPQFDEDFELFALDVLDRGDKEAIGLHVAQCEDCARRLEEARGRVTALAFAAPAQLPSEESRERLLRSVRAFRQPGGYLGLSFSRPLRWLAPGFVLATAVLAILYVQTKDDSGRLRSRIHELEAQQRSLEVQTERARAVLDVLTAPDTLKVTLVRGAATPPPQGKAFYNPNKGLVFYAANLPRLSRDKTYELWIIPREGSPIAAGTFDADPKGNGEVLLPPLPSGVAAKALAVTVEPAGGFAQPSSTPILVGPVS